MKQANVEKYEKYQRKMNIKMDEIDELKVKQF